MSSPSLCFRDTVPQDKEKPHGWDPQQAACAGSLQSTERDRESEGSVLCNQLHHCAAVILSVDSIVAEHVVPEQAFIPSLHTPISRAQVVLPEDWAHL